MSYDYSNYVKKIKAGETIFTEGDESYEMYFVHAGEVRIEKNIEGKAELLALLQKGDFFGEMSLLDHVPRSATAITNSDVELLEVNGDNFSELLEGNIEIAVRIIRKYIARLRETNQRLMDALKVKNEMDKEIQEIVKVAETAASVPQLKPVAALDVSGKLFFIFPGESSIGRIDPATGLSPTIDLTEVDPQKTTSRKHARIKVSDENKTFEMIEEIGVKNGTLVNGAKVSQSSFTLLTSGDKILVGKISMVFKVLA